MTSSRRTTTTGGSSASCGAVSCRGAALAGSVPAGDAGRTRGR
jgi:hypothetical protein